MKIRFSTSGETVKVSGETQISIKIMDEPKEIPTKVFVANITDDMLLSWTDLIGLGVLKNCYQGFPNPTPEIGVSPGLQLPKRKLLSA